MACTVGTLALVALLIGASDESQQPSQPPLKGKVSIVVPQVLGPPSARPRALGRSLRKNLRKGLGKLVPTSKLRRAQRRLRQPRSYQRTHAAMGSAGQLIGAEYVLRVRIRKIGWQYKARAVLIRSRDRTTVMDFVSGYFRPGDDAADRGRRIARKTLEKLELLRAPQEEAPPPPEPGPTAPPPVATAPEPAEETRVPETTTTGETPVESTVEKPSKPAERAPFFRIGLLAGSGLYYDYALSSGSVDRSELSHSLRPFAVLNADLSVRIPGTPLEALASVRYSPIRFDFETEGQAQVTPTGALIDFNFALQFNLPLTTWFELCAATGVRVNSLSVNEQPEAVLLSRASIAPFLALGFDLTLGEIVDIWLNGHAGWIVHYNEDPLRTGDSALRSARAGLELQSRAWLSSSIGVALIGRFDFERVVLSGTPTRPTPVGELISDAVITTRAAQLSVGVVYRY